MIIHYPRYIGVTEDEEAIVLRALEVHRNLLRNLAGKKYGRHEHRVIKAKRLATIEALMDRVFPEGLTQVQQCESAERELAKNPPVFTPEDERVYRALAQDAQKRGGRMP